MARWLNGSGEPDDQTIVDLDAVVGDFYIVLDPFEVRGRVFELSDVDTWSYVGSLDSPEAPSGGGGGGEYEPPEIFEYGIAGNRYRLRPSEIHIDSGDNYKTTYGAEVISRFLPDGETQSNLYFPLYETGVFATREWVVANPVGGGGVEILYHGSDASVERTEDMVLTIWVGSVIPDNALITDILQIS